MHLTNINQASEFVTLRPLSTEYFDALIEIAKDKNIWTHYPMSLHEPDLMRGNLEQLLQLQAARQWIAHVVIAPNGEIVGQTCYLNLREPDCGVEIGGTWYDAKYHGSKINPAAKLLMLGNAFDAGAVRVEFKTDELNLKSRAAILKLGAKFEGIFRKHMKRVNGTWRDSAYYSIIDSEWPAVKAGLEARLAAR
ncbi:MAG: N-acetyltransferase GCN5 [Hyphomonadaceae bacterium]|nr:MAG: N-acetyltransferase GCN5 [Hyphomonadaceae bacterium]KAF0184401.1 MAG: N-acetyltransferase GCN5 [Hyphomonadaceae bacterium]